MYHQGSTLAGAALGAIAGGIGFACGGLLPLEPGVLLIASRIGIAAVLGIIGFMLGTAAVEAWVFSEESSENGRSD